MPGNFCRLLITFANSLGPDQDGRNIDPVLDPNGLTLWQCSERFLKKLIFETKSADDKNPAKLPSM